MVANHTHPEEAPKQELEAEEPQQSAVMGEVVQEPAEQELLHVLQHPL
jgi:hypothetical protein